MFPSYYKSLCDWLSPGHFLSMVNSMFSVVCTGLNMFLYVTLCLRMPPFVQSILLLGICISIFLALGDSRPPVTLSSLDPEYCSARLSRLLGVYEFPCLLSMGPLCLWMATFYYYFSWVCFNLNLSILWAPWLEMSIPVLPLFVHRAHFTEALQVAEEEETKAQVYSIIQLNSPLEVTIPHGYALSLPVWSLIKLLSVTLKIQRLKSPSFKTISQLKQIFIIFQSTS